jgi:hypothetical protein
MYYSPRFFPDELYISIFNRLDHLTGTLQWTTQKSRIRPRHKVDRPKTLSLLHTELGLNNETHVKNFNWDHTFAPIINYQNSDNWLHKKNISNYLGAMCQDCIREDIKVHGTAYVHRSHNFSQIKFCHIHSTQLEYTCSVCFRSHRSHTASDYYECSQKQASMPTISATATPVELEYAKFVYDLLNKIKAPFKKGSINQAFRNRAIDLGLSQGCRIYTKAIEAYAENVLRKISHNLTFSSCNLLPGNIPGERFFLILFVLFRDISCLLEYVDTPQGKGLASQYYNELKEKKAKLYNILSNSNYNDFKTIIDDHLELITWFRKHDSSALSHALTQHNLSSRRSDEYMVSEVHKIAEYLYSTGGKPVRTTLKRIVEKSNLPKFSSTQRMSRHPKLYFALRENTESTHHYYIRVILWAAPLLGADDRRFSKLNGLTGISNAQLLPVAKYFGWVVADDLTSNLPSKFTELSLPVTWSLPGTVNSVD